MTRDEQITEATRLRAEGLPFRQIAERIGVATTTAVRWLNPDYAERSRAISRAWKDRNREANRARDNVRNRDLRGTCGRCDGPMGIACPEDGTCTSCRSALRHERCLHIVEMWAEGKTYPQICAELGWTKGTLAVEFDRMRGQGYDLPYRYHGQRNGRKHPAAMT